MHKLHNWSDVGEPIAYYLSYSTVAPLMQRHTKLYLHSFHNRAGQNARDPIR